MSDADRSQTDRQADERRMAGYLRGEAAVFHEIDGWIRKDLQVRYPVLRHEIEDLCQTVHAKLLLNLRAGHFQQRSTLRTYVVGIAHHTAVDRIRQLYREPFPSRDAPVLPPGSNPYTDLEAREENQVLYQVLERSPAACRHLWRLIFLERLSYAEIGRRLSIPPGTVKSRAWHCRQKALALWHRLLRAGSRPPRRAKKGT